MDSLPKEVLQRAAQGAFNAQSSGRFPKAKCFLEKDTQTNEEYLFVLNSISDNSSDNSLDTLRAGGAIAVDVEGRKLRSLHGKEIEAIHLSGIPFVVFKVTDFP